MFGNDLNDRRAQLQVAHKLIRVTLWGQNTRVQHFPSGMEAVKIFIDIAFTLIFGPAVLRANVHTVYLAETDTWCISNYPTPRRLREIVSKIKFEYHNDSLIHFLPNRCD